MDNRSDDPNMERQTSEQHTPSTDISLTDEALAQLDIMLDAFTRYRQENENSYIEHERKQKEALLAELGKAWEHLDDNPDESRRLLIKVFGRKISAINKVLNQLLGGRHARDDQDTFRKVLEDIDADTYSAMMKGLFDTDIAPSERTKQFQEDVKGLSDQTNANVPLHLPAVLLASYNPDEYIFYRPTDQGKTASELNLSVPHPPELRYPLFLDIFRIIFFRGRQKGAPLHDLLDAYNLNHVFWNYEHFEDARKRFTGERGVDAEMKTSIYEFIRRREFVFPEWLVTSYVVSLATKPFAILSGVSGTGKTKLAQMVAEYAATVAANPDAETIVAVRPDWTDNSPLLGWYNAISEHYEAPPVLQILRRADANPAQPYFIILDEMNIAKVEHYFSDFLSAMEGHSVDSEGRIRRARLHLHNRDENDAAEDDVPPFINLPLNVYVTGTVNVDESTYMFSPKVLDRANVIEFNEVALDPNPIPATTDINETPTEGAPVAETGHEPGYPPGTFVLREDVSLSDLFSGYKPITRAAWDEMRQKMPRQFQQLLRIHTALRHHNMHFGYRVANEVAAFMLNAQRFCVPNDDLLPAALDIQIMQKILPKLHGNAAELETPLADLQGALPPGCRLSQAKLKRMRQRLEHIGFTSFIE